MIQFLKKARSEKCGRARDRKTTESLLLLAASRLFSQKGFENTRTLEIAKEAGVNESLILRYFGGKEGLLTAVLKDDEALQSLLSQQNSHCADSEMFPVDDPKCRFRDALKTFFENAKTIVDAKEPFMRIASSRALVDEEMATVVRERLMDRQSKMLRGRVVEFFKLRGKKIGDAEMDSLVLLISSVNHVMNFTGRKIYKVDPVRLDQTLGLFAEMVDHYYQD